MPEIQKWSDIKDRFQDGLLIGNGASVAIHNGFQYSNLFDAACRLEHVTKDVKSVFDSFGTNDFELVLRRLWQAKLVNDALGVQPGRVQEAYELVRTALIATVRATHVSYTNAKPHLEHVYQFLKGFKTVVSLNYDLILYWAAMLGNSDATVRNWFKDAFNDAIFRDDWESVRLPYGAQGATLFFYLHGNLVLARKRFEIERKLSAGSNATLLDEILEDWETGNFSPIFVCEGTAAHKKKSIESSAYLRKIFHEVIPTLGKSLVIYGWSISEQDTHIVTQLKNANISRAAVSVYGNSQEAIRNATKLLGEAGIKEVHFFDSLSPGCWNNPRTEV